MLPSSDRARNPEDWVGVELCGKWRLEELIGVGGMATVFAATDRSGTRVAVKLLHAYYANDEDVRRRFLREGYAANRVKHPAVVSARADGIEAGGLPFLVLELLDGVALDRVIEREGPLDPGRVLDIADQVLDALSAAHAQGVVHRDLKPDNLIVGSDGAICVVDFGIAYLESQGPGPRMTVQGYAMGTPSFMAPEQARGDIDAVGERTDIWSLGATMFSLLTGRDVFIGSPQAVLVATVTRQAPPVRSLAPKVPPAIAAIVDRALAFDPSERWQSARGMQLAIAGLRAKHHHDVPTLVPVAATCGDSRHPLRWQSWVAAAAGAVAISLAGATDYLSVQLGAVPVVKPVLATTVEVIISEARASESESAAPCGTACDRNASESASCLPSHDACPLPAPAHDSSRPR